MAMMIKLADAPHVEYWTKLFQPILASFSALCFFIKISSFMRVMLQVYDDFKKNSLRKKENMRNLKFNNGNGIYK